MPPQNRSKVPLGTVLEGKFRVTKEIGRGGMAAVYEAENVDIGKRVAVKILAAELLTSRVVRERFIREARASAAIRSPYICDVYDSGMFEDRPFLVMELLEGESLYDMLTRVRQLDASTTLLVATQACRGLTKAHELSVVHRDLKPENIFITRDEEGALLAKILDFGLAKFYEPTGGTAEQARLTREGALFGTPAYMSPEQARGQGEVDHRCDLWALGCIVYECLTGQTVWNVEQGVAMILAQIAGAPIPRPSRLRPDLPPTFDPWFLRALDRDPDKRFQTAKEFADSLAEALTPSTGSVRTTPLHSEEEALVVDRLISSELSEAGLSSPSAGAEPLVSLPSAPAAAPEGTIPENFDRSLAPLDEAPRTGSAGRALGWLLGVSALALGGYGAWLYWIHPPPRPAQPTVQAPPSTRPAPSTTAAPAEKLEPRESDPFALQISTAQEWLEKGKRDNALALFKEAFNNGGSGVARALLSQAGLALATSANERCQVTGLGRPRPFDDTTVVSRPTIAMGPRGVVVAWVDNHQDPKRRQAFAVVLDSALRRVTPPRMLTPEASSVRFPQLVQAEEQLTLLYFDTSGEDPGVFARMLEPDGRIAGPARRVSGQKRDDFNPSLARAADGAFWAVWSEEVENGGRDLVARKLNPTLAPAGDVVRLTQFVHRRGVAIDASDPDAIIDGDELDVVFSLTRDKAQEVMHLRVKLSDPALAKGLVLPEEKPAPRKKAEDRFIGELRAISRSHGKNTEPHIACAREGCFVVWDDEKAGANAAYLDRSGAQPLWHREFASKGSRPTVAAVADAALVAWYEGGRLKAAHITRDGIDKGSTVGRVSGFQPSAAVVPGEKVGEWYLTWRDYEAGHLEAFVARTQCR